MTQDEFKKLKPGDIVETPNGNGYEVKSSVIYADYPYIAVSRAYGAHESGNGGQFFLAAAANYSLKLLNHKP